MPARRAPAPWVAVRAARAADPARAVVDGRGECTGRGGSIGMHERGRQQGGIAPGRDAVDHDELRPCRRQQLEARPGCGHRPEADDQLRPVRVDPGSGTDQLIATDHDVAAVVAAAAQTGQRVGNDGKAGRGGQPGDGGGQHPARRSDRP